jgi:hypothetical protein
LLPYCLRGNTLAAARKSFCLASKKLLTLIVLLLPAELVLANPDASDITDIVLVTGQSNVTGSQTIYDPLIDTVDLKVFAYTDNETWEVADLHQAWDIDGWHPGNDSIADPKRQPYNNFAFHFAKTVVERDPSRVVGIIVAGAPGEGILHWDANGDFYGRIKDKVADALSAHGAKTSIDAVLWHQGETDWLIEGTSDPDASQSQKVDKTYYPDKLNSLISNLRSESWFSDNKPFICGETKRADLNETLRKLNDDQDSWTGCVPAEDLCTREGPEDDDHDGFCTEEEGTHFNSSGLRKLGERYGNKYLDIIEANDTSNNTQPALTSPIANSILTYSTGTEEFAWTAASTNVSHWWLSLGISPQSGNYFSSGSLPGSTASVTVSGLPVDGSTIHATLWYRIAGTSAWHSVAHTYTANTNQPVFTNPISGSNLDGAVETFNWAYSGNENADYWLELGSSSGTNNLYNSGNLGNSTGAVVSGLPNDGSSTVYARLWYRFDNTAKWLHVDATFVAGTGTTPVPQIISHEPAQSLTDINGTETLTWEDGGSAATEFWVYAGATQGSKSYYDSGSISDTLTTNVADLPTDGSTIWVRLWYRPGSGTWDYIDEQYVAVNGLPTIQSSSGITTLASPDDTFTWADPSGQISEWWLYVGTTHGGRDLLDSGNLSTATSYQTHDSSLPTGGIPVHVRLWYRTATNTWRFIDQEFTSAP